MEQWVLCWAGEGSPNNQMLPLTEEAQQELQLAEEQQLAQEQAQALAAQAAQEQAQRLQQALQQTLKQAQRQRRRRNSRPYRSRRSGLCSLSSGRKSRSRRWMWWLGTLGLGFWLGRMRNSGRGSSNPWGLGSRSSKTLSSTRSS